MVTVQSAEEICGIIMWPGSKKQSRLRTPTSDISGFAGEPIFPATTTVAIQIPRALKALFGDDQASCKINLTKQDQQQRRRRVGHYRPWRREGHGAL
jgi:hypothetical protein